MLPNLNYGYRYQTNCHALRQSLNTTEGFWLRPFQNNYDLSLGVDFLTDNK